MNKLFEWIVVGAGPAGIASVGKLLDAGIMPSEITWIDPNFKVGDFSLAWGHVMSNTPVESFLKFYQQSKSFKYLAKPNFIIEKSLQSQTCPLMIAAQPLHWITEHLSQTVNSMKDVVLSLTPNNNTWQLNLASEKMLYTKKVILAIGANANELNFPNTYTVPLKTALNLNKLQQSILPDDYVAVFGSAQSAKSVVENLHKIKTKKNILFYRSENSLSRHLGHEEFNHIETLAMTPKNLLLHMPHCTKIIYAIGFSRRHVPIAGLPTDYGYDTKTGEIAPGVFGLGIAFPEILPYELGQIEYRVTAIWPFMKRLDKLLPLWLS